MGDARRGGAQRNAALWVLAFGAIGVALLARNLLGLDRTPPGMYVDETSIGYNAWAIAHYGVDEHGSHLPLYFQAFGEYKNPLYIYALVPFLRVLPVTATVERLPAVVFGVIAVLFITLAAWRISRSRGVTLFIVALAALTPWLTQESRVGFEVITLVATMAVAVWCLADDSASRRLALHSPASSSPSPYSRTAPGGWRSSSLLWLSHSSTGTGGNGGSRLFRLSLGTRCLVCGRCNIRAR